MTAPGPPLVTLVLPSAPPVTTAVAAPLRRPKGPAVGLVGLGALLIFGPIIGGMFAKTAAGNQLINNFAPYMQSGALARDVGDIHFIESGAAGLDEVYRTQHIPQGQFPGLETFRRESSAIVGRASDLLHRVSGAQGDYQHVARIGGFDRLPFLLVTCGIVALYGGCVLLAGHRSRVVPAAVLVVLASVALAVYPFVSDLFGGSGAGQRMLHSLAPVMTAHQVRQLQEDFIVLVDADGELSTTFRGIARPGPSATAIASLVHRWPAVSSDLASLTGVIDDNLNNFNSLEELDRVPRAVGLSGFGAYPWVLVAVGTLSAGLTIGALPRRQKEFT